MSKRDKRREQTGGWQDANHSMSLEEAAGIGYGLNVKESENNSAIIAADNGVFLYKRFELRTTGVVIPENIKIDEWIDIFGVLRKLDETIQWSVGDLVNYAEKSWGETYSYMAEITGYSEKSLREYAYVSRSVHLSIRMDKLSFGHHQLIAGMKDTQTKEPLIDEQKHWLQQAVDNEWSVAKLREAISGKKNKKTQFDKVFSQLNNLAKASDKLSKPERLQIRQYLEQLLEQYSD